MPDVDAPRSSDATPDAALSRPRAINPWVVAIALLLGAMFVNFWTLGDSPLARTEGHRALTGHELTVRGEWVTPTLYGEVYLRKPPGHYWLIAVTEIVTGQSNEWVWRLPSALAAVGVVMLMWVMGRRWFGEIGGAAAGLSCLGMVALWSQNRAAEIDALNTLATVGCACCVLECGFGPTRRRWAWGIGIAVSMAWLLFLKGPAGLPLVGGVFIGASIATQKWAWAKRPSVWVSVIAGIAIFGAWGVAAAVTMKAQPGATDTSGPNEVLNRLTPEDMSHLIKAALMPLTLIGYSMPWSAAVLLGLIPSVTRSMDDHKTRYRARAAIGTVVAAMCVCGMVLMTRPRYGYITLPMVSLVVAAFAESWHRGYFDERLRAILRQIMTITAMLFAGLCGVLTWMSWQEGSEHRAWLIGGAVATGLLLVVAVGAWVMKKHRPGTWAVALMIVTSSIAFNDYKHVDREERSGHQLAAELRSIIQDQPLVAEKAIMDHPEVFYYLVEGGDHEMTRVQRYPRGMEDAVERPEPAWFIVHDEEWEVWSKKLAPRVIKSEQLKGEFKKWKLIWYMGKPTDLDVQ